MSIEVNYRGRREPDRLRVYYDGVAGAVEAGYALCYKEDATVAGTTGADTRFVTVEQPSTANLNLFAGIAAEDIGAAGWLDIYPPQPGMTCSALVKANVTNAGATALKPTNAAWSLEAHSDSGLNLPAVALAGEAADTSTTAANKTIYFK